MLTSRSEAVIQILDTQVWYFICITIAEQIAAVLTKDARPFPCIYDPLNKGVDGLAIM